MSYNWHIGTDGLQGKERKLLVIFGGNSLTGLLNDVVVLDLETFEWKTIKVEGQAPTKCYYHTATSIDTNKIFIFGGRTADGATNDAYILETSESLEDWKWTKLSISGHPPSKRYQHQVFKLDSNSVLIYGGIKKMTVLHDLTVCNLGNSIILISTDK
jgi:hypothetical protein